MKFPFLKHEKSTLSAQRFIDANAKNFRLIFFAFIVGLVSGIIGSVFRYLLQNIEVFRDNLYIIVEKGNVYNWFFPILIGISGVAVSLFLIKKFAPEASGSGVQEIEGALDNLRPLRWKKVIPVKFIASLFSLGSGFLLGREGPTIQLGANIGKMIKDIFKQADEENNPLISAGAAAGLASAFNAPFSGIIFVIEEMHGHFKHNFFSVAAIMLASGTSDLVSRALIGANPVIKMTLFKAPALSNLWLFIFLGIILSFIGFFFNKLLILSLDFFNNYKKKLLLLSIVSGVLIAVIGIYSPDMIGGGYKTIRLALDNSFTLQFLLILFLGRFILTIFSYGIGLPGGIFAPLLAIGVLTGIIFGTLTQYYLPETVSNPGIFAVAGMAGIFAATIRAPLTGLILAVEMTSNFELILPLIFTSVAASLFTTALGNQPIYTVLLNRTLKKAKK
ncbi:MAG: H(+)/Cl(-) exchange transporter ClcA [Bacteroidales bacterium]|nr:H(+)/Cl(-) exchange transporter ClcA [Bacteroidales bacterium]